MALLRAEARAGRRPDPSIATGLRSSAEAAMADMTSIDLARVRELAEAENTRFSGERPRSMALQEQACGSMPRGVPMAWMDDLYDHPPVWVSHGEGARFTDVDGHTYLDMYVADMSAFCGHAPPPVIEAVSRRMRLGNQFLLPGEDAIVVAEHLADRYGLPQWQFTLSATQANTEVIRLAREVTGREIVLMFDAKYHGEGDATLVVQEEGELVPESRGLLPGIAAQARIVQFNDIVALEAALEPGDVALVLAEPAMTNAGFLLPRPGYHEARSVHGAWAVARAARHFEGARRAAHTSPFLQHRQHVAGRVLEPGDERPLLTEDASLVLLEPLEALEFDAALDQTVDGRVDGGNLEIENGVASGLGARLFVDERPAVVGVVKPHQPVLLGRPHTEGVGVEAPGVRHVPHCDSAVGAGLRQHLIPP
jgi:hypothetical protein